MNGEDPQRRRYYDVEKFRAAIDDSRASPPLKGFTLALTRIMSAFDSVRGLVNTLVGMAVVFAIPLFVVIGALYGPFSFVASFVGSITLLGVYVERRQGKSLQVTDYNVGIRAIMQLAALAALLAILFFIAFLLPHI